MGSAAYSVIDSGHCTRYFGKSCSNVLCLVFLDFWRQKFKNGAAEKCPVQDENRGHLHATVYVMSYCRVVYSIATGGGGGVLNDML